MAASTDENLLVTCASDSSVTIWRVSLVDNPNDHWFDREMFLSGFYRRRETSETRKSRRSSIDVSENLVSMIVYRFVFVGNKKYQICWWIKSTMKHWKSLWISINRFEHWISSKVGILLSFSTIDPSFSFCRNFEWSRWKWTFEKYSITIFWWSFKYVAMITMCLYLWYSVDLLFSYVIDWNTNTRHSTEAQIIIKILLSIVSPEKIMKLPNGPKCVESLLPYTGKFVLSNLS